MSSEIIGLGTGRSITNLTCLEFKKKARILLKKWMNC